MDLWMPAPFWAETQRGNVSLATVEKCFISWKDRVRQGVVSWLEDLSPLIGSITQGLLTGHHSIINNQGRNGNFERTICLYFDSYVILKDFSFYI